MSSMNIVPSNGGIPVTGEIVTPHSEAMSRQEKARVACQLAGIEWPETILPPGTALYQSGVEKLRSDRAQWRKLPLASDVINMVEAALKLENRQDYLTDVRGLRLRPADGRIVTPDLINSDPRAFAGMAYGPHSLRQLVAQIDPLNGSPRGFANALLYLDDQERAEIVNKRILRWADGDPKNVTLRTRQPHYGDGTIMRAALSKIYGSVTDYDIAGALAGILVTDRSARLDYKPGDNRSRFEAIWPSEIPIGTFVVGDVHYAVLQITNSETGQGGLRISIAVVRAACANLTVRVGQGIEINIRHIGDHETLMHRLRAAIRMALNDIEPLIATITQSAVIEVQEEPAALFEKIAAKYALPKAAATAWDETFKRGYDTPILQTKVGADRMATAFNKPTVWSLTSAITEAAHSATGNWTNQQDWERVASDVLDKSVTAQRGGASNPLMKALTEKVERVEAEVA